MLFNSFQFQQVFLKKERFLYINNILFFFCIAKSTVTYITHKYPGHWLYTHTPFSMKSKKSPVNKTRPILVKFDSLFSSFFQRTYVRYVASNKLRIAERYIRVLFIIYVYISIYISVYIYIYMYVHNYLQIYTIRTKSDLLILSRA